MCFVSQGGAGFPSLCWTAIPRPWSIVLLGEQTRECQSPASSQGPARAAASRMGTHRKGKDWCFSGSSAALLRNENHLLSNIFLERGYGL